MFMWTFADFANADVVWDGGGTDANWTTGVNWDTNTAPDTITPELIEFAGTIQTITNNDFAADALTVTGIGFRNTVAGESFTLNGNRVWLDGDITTLASSGSIEDTINLQLRLTGNRTINTGTNHNLTISGVIDEDGTSRSLTKLGTGVLKLSGANTFSGGMTIGNSANQSTNVVQIGVDSVGSAGSVTSSALGTGTLTFLGARLSSDGTTTRTIHNDVVLGTGGGNSAFLGDTVNTGELTFEGAMNLTGNRTVTVDSSVNLDGVVSGLSFDKFGSGTLTLNAANTNVGFSVGAGRLVVNHANALGNDNRIQGIGTMEIANGLTIANALTIINDGGNKTLDVTTGSATYSGTITVEDGTDREFDVRAAVDTTLNLTGVISGTGGAGVNSVGDGTINLTQANTFTGGFHLGDGVASTFDGASGSKQGFVVVNDNQSLGTGTAIARGSQLQAGVSGINIGNDINVDGGGLRMGGSNSFELSGKLAAIGGSRTFAHYGLDGVDITISGELDLDEGGTARNMDFAGSDGKNNGDFLVTGNITGGGNVTVSSSFDNGVVNLSGDNSAHSGNYTVTGGTLLLNSTDSIGTGNITLSGGRLELGQDDAIRDTAIITQTGGTFDPLDGHEDTVHSYQATGGTLNFGGTSELTFLNNSQVNNVTVGSSGTIRLADGVTLTQSGTSSALGDNDSLNFDVGAGGLADMTGSINTGKGNGEVNKTGAGTLRLSNDTSQFGGGTRVENGTLEFSSIVDAGTNETSSLGDADFDNTLQIGSAANAATLRMIGTNAKNSSNRAVQLGDAGGTIDVFEAAQTLTLSGVVSDVSTLGDLTKAGAGTLVLSGNNTYTGNTSITAGTLQVGNGGTTGTLGTGGDLDVSAAATVNFNRTDNLAFDGAITGAGDINVNSGTLTISNANTHSGSLTVASGANLDGEGSTAGSLVFAGTAHAINTDLTTAAALGSTGTGSTDVSALAAGGFTVNTSGTGTGATEVLTYGSGGFIGGLDRFTATGSLSARGATFADSGTAITIDAGFVENIWQGTNPTNPTFWDIGTTGNWSNTADAVWQEDDNAIFGDTATDFAPTLQSNVTAGEVTFTNTANAYTLASSAGEVLTINDSLEAANTAAVTISANLAGGDDGLNIIGSGDMTISGVISGSNGLFKSGTGTTTVTGVRTSSGGIFANGGTLKFVNEAITDNASYTVATGATLEFDYVSGNGNIGTLDLVGNGTFKKTGSGVLQLTSFGADVSLGSAGLIHVAEGVFSYGGGSPGIWTNNLSDMLVDSGATFEGKSSSVIIDELNGAGTVGIGGKTGTAGLTIGADNGSGNFTGTIKNTNTDGQAHSLTKIGTGTQTLSGSSNYTGLTTVSGGTLAFVNSAISSGRAYVVETGATLEHVNSSGGQLNTGVITLSGGGTFKKSGTNTIEQTSAGSTVSMDSGALFHVAEGTYRFGLGGIGDWSSNLSDLQIDSGAAFQGSATPAVFDELNGSGTAQFGGGVTLGVDNGDGTFSGVIQNDTTNNPDTAIRNSLVKSGTGTQTLSGNNTYTGTTTVSAGTLVVNGDQSAATGAVTVADGATLKGNGTIGATATTISGTHAPGESIGFQKFNGDLAYESTATFEWELFENTEAGRGTTGFDAVNLVGGGTLDLGDAILELKFDSSGSNVDFGAVFWSQDREWEIFNGAGTLAGNFDSTLIVGDDSSAGMANGIFEVDYSRGPGSVYLTFTAVPEPTSLLIFGMGIAMLGMGRRRKAREIK